MLNMETKVVVEKQITMKKLRHFGTCCFYISKRKSITSKTAHFIVFFHFLSITNNFL